LDHQTKPSTKIIICFSVMFGFATLFIALAANRLGLDHNVVWGAKRIFLAVLGIGLLLVSLELIFQARLRPFWSKVAQTYEAIVRWMANRRIVRWAKKTRERVSVWPWVQALFGTPLKRLLWGMGIIIIVSSGWYITLYLNNATARDGIHTGYYEELAQAFQKGQTSLLVDPPTALLKLSDPYDYQQRQNIGGVIWDATLYHGKYYLYWGPVPALLVVAVKAFTSFPGADDKLILAFTWGYMLFSILLIGLLWWRHFRAHPVWLTVGAGLMAAFNYTMCFLVTDPNVYEAAIAGGQCFLMAGFFFLVLALGSEKPPLWSFGLAGFSLGLAVGCRLSLAPTVIVVFLLVSAWTIWSHSLQKGWPSIAALLLPLALSAAGLAWYNWVRFGSIFETGHRFQLSSVDMSTGRTVMGFFNIPPNIYTFFLRPFQWTGKFPFLNAPAIRNNMWPSFLYIPETYLYREAITGIIPSSPYLWLAIIPVIGFIYLIWQTISHRTYSATLSKVTTWLNGLFIGAALVECALLLIYTSSSMRYLNDLTPTLSILAALGIWQIDDWASTSSVRQKWVRRLIFCLMLVSFFFSLGINLSSMLK
jgi:hypothetical protein